MEIMIKVHVSAVLQETVAVSLHPVVMVIAVSASRVLMTAMALPSLMQRHL
jgi:hypothetical protein